MGRMIHHWIVVTSWKAEAIEQAHAKAEDFGCLVSGISPRTVNGWSSFCVFPDGSKEGWAESGRGDGAREALIDWINGQRYEDGSNAFEWAELAMGELGYARNDATLLRHGYRAPERHSDDEG